MGEPQSWTAHLGFRPVVHVGDGEPVYVYGAVFAPIKLTTRVVHVWRYYDAKKREWLTKMRHSFEIKGGRENGYRGYSTYSGPQAGLWRVDIDSIDGRLIGRIEFDVENTHYSGALLTTVMD